MSSAISIGSYTLDSNSVPIVKVNYDYAKTRSGEIVGGFANYNISGTISVGDDGTLTGATIMSKLKSIRDLGKNSKCVQVSIPGYYTGEGRITNVTIEQGPDPSWINQGSYSIDIKTKLSTLPPNSLGIVLTDFVSEISISEAIELGEDSHGYVFNGNLTKSFAKFTNKITVKCEPPCSSDGTPFEKALGVLTRVLSIGPKNNIFNQYKTWRPLLQSRSLEMNNDGTISFSADMILLPSCATYNALVDLTFTQNKGYQDKSESRIISGNITGLTPISWSDLITLNSSCDGSKLQGAEAAFQYIKGLYSNIGSWNGISLELLKYPNCPNSQSSSAVASCEDNNINSQIPCIEPQSSSISKSRVEGTISFNFEWGKSDPSDCSSNGLKKEIVIDVQEPQKTIVEYIIVNFGTLIQDINCNTARRLSGTLTITSDDGVCPSLSTCSSGSDDLIEALTKQGLDQSYLLITDTEQTTISSYTKQVEYIKGCA